MEIVEDIVIAGAGLAGLATALGLHRQGIRSLVLESSDSLRVAGFAILTWSNAWKALDAPGVGDTLRLKHDRLQRLLVHSLVSGEVASELAFKGHEVRCLKRRFLMEALEQELPRGTIRFASKVVAIEESGHFKLVHLADGTIIKTKVLIGCDGVNSVVAKWLGLDTPVFTGRSAIRAYADVKGGHGFGSKCFQIFGNGVRTGFLPCDDQTVHWFLTYTPSIQDKDMEDNPTKLKQFALSKIGNLPAQLKSIGNVCVAGDALHAMTPEIGQGGCSALEDSVVLARCVAEALSKPGDEEWKRIQKGLEKYAKERRWRSFELISTAYIVGTIQQSSGKIMNFLRGKILSQFLVGLMLGRAGFDCGKLSA
ncbi:hypothetical protein SLA2020_169430 [Shorea laevis]